MVHRPRLPDQIGRRGSRAWLAILCALASGMLRGWFGRGGAAEDGAADVAGVGRRTVWRGDGGLGGHTGGERFGAFEQPSVASGRRVDFDREAFGPASGEARGGT